MSDSRDERDWPRGLMRGSDGSPRAGSRAGTGAGGEAARTPARRGRRPRGPVGAERARDPEACREAALRLLERTRRTRSDLSRRLKDKGYEAAVIDQVIARLESVGLIDDVEFARAYLAGRWGRRAAGWRVLENDLRRRGVSQDDMAAARAGFESERGGADEIAGALRAIEQAARRYAKLEPRLRRQRLWGLLARKGFDGETIEAALRMAETGGDRD